MSDLEKPLKNVLVVDDEDELRKAVAYDFKKRGYRVYEANNGKIALQIVKDNPIDLVFSDVRMPFGDGIELLKMIRLLDPKTPIVLLATGFADLSEVEAISLGAFGLLEKPINRKTMFEILERVFSKAAT